MTREERIANHPVERMKPLMAQVELGLDDPFDPPSPKEKNLSTTANLINQDGMIIDAETGEIVDFEPPAGAEAEWALSRARREHALALAAEINYDDANEFMHKMEVAALEALKENPEYAHALLIRDANEEIMLASRARRDALAKRFEKAIFDWALPQLAKGERTLAHALAKISFRKQPARLAVRDEALALEWLEANAPQAVKKSVLVSKVPAEAKEAPGFETVPEIDLMSIEWGVK